MYALKSVSQSVSQYAALLTLSNNAPRFSRDGVIVEDRVESFGKCVEPGAVDVPSHRLAALPPDVGADVLVPHARHLADVVHVGRDGVVEQPLLRLHHQSPAVGRDVGALGVVVVGVEPQPRRVVAGDGDRGGGPPAGRRKSGEEGVAPVHLGDDVEVPFWVDHQ